MQSRIDFIHERMIPHAEALELMRSADLAIGKMKMGYYANTQIESMMLGADCCTLPPKVLWQLSQHPLTDRGLEAFLADWETLGATI